MDGRAGLCGTRGVHGVIGHFKGYEPGEYVATAVIAQGGRVIVTVEAKQLTVSKACCQQGKATVIYLPLYRREDSALGSSYWQHGTLKTTSPCWNCGKGQTEEYVRDKS